MLSLSKNLKESIEQRFLVRLNQNQFQELTRLIYEILRREPEVTTEKLFAAMDTKPSILNSTARDRIAALKNLLISRRFPLTNQQERVEFQDIFLPPLKPPLPRLPLTQPFQPEKIFIEKEARNSSLAQKVLQMFPSVPVRQISAYSESFSSKRFNLSEFKQPWLFIVQEKWDFIRPCPCTSGHIGCNYWIFNLGFGCPYDCSYCFLQQYANFPGLVLPANLEDYFDRFIEFEKKLKRPIRIGTGEFCDSLALDHITGYAKQLIEFFRERPVLFELKTKSASVEGVLQCTGTANIILSWSLNPQLIIDTEEQGAASLQARLKAASAVQRRGFSLAFHFDPLILFPDWKKHYASLIHDLYENARPPFKWISLGTLRGTRQLKSASERRFPESGIFYGELLLGKDRKLRYPLFLRRKIYRTIHRLIRQYDKKTPVYLCMEDEQCWQDLEPKIKTSARLERYLLGESI